MIRINNLEKVYKNLNINLTALKDFNLHVDKGSIYSIVGPSGCGKSTLLLILAGIINNYEGSISVNGRPTQESKSTVSLILQDYGLLPWKTVWQNVILGLEIKKADKSTIKERAEHAIRQVGLHKFHDMYPSQLSGGQRQRVAIARAISMQSSILLMDEPLSALDAITREEAQETFIDLWKKTGMTVMLVTHNIEEAVYLGNKIGVMSQAPGKIVYEINNSYSGDISLRETPVFYEMCAEVRKQLKAVGKDRDKDRDKDSD